MNIMSNLSTKAKSGSMAIAIMGAVVGGTIVKNCAGQTKQTRTEAENRVLMNKTVDELKKDSLETKEIRANTKKIFEALQAYNTPMKKDSVLQQSNEQLGAGKTVK